MKQFKLLLIYDAHIPVNKLSGYLKSIAQKMMHYTFKLTITNEETENVHFSSDRL